MQAGVTVDSAVNLLPGAIVHGRQGVDLDIVDHVLHAGEMAGERNCGISRNRPQSVAGQGDHTVLHVDADGVKRVAITYAIVLQLLHDLLLQLRVRDLAGARNLKIVANRNDVLGAMGSLIDLFLGREVIDRAFEIDDPVLDRYLYAFVLLQFVLELCLNVVVSLRVLT